MKPAYRSRWLHFGYHVRATQAPPRIAIFSVVAFALLMSALDATIVATALRAIQHGLHASINWTSWVITSYAIGLVLALSAAGGLSDRIGRRRFFIISVVIFTGASACCGVAKNIYVLIALRAVQAAGGAGFTPAATGIIVENFGSARDRAIGFFGSILSVGAMTGPIFGGVFVTYWSWRGIFFVNVPIGILLIPLCLRYIPKDGQRATGESTRIDLTGLMLLAVGTLAAMLGISYLGEPGVRAWSPVFTGTMVVGLVGFGQFGRHIRHSSDPFIEPRFIAGRGFGAVNVINVFYGGVAGGLLALVPLYAVDRYGISTLGSGTLLTAEGIAFIVVSSLATMGLRRTGYRRAMYVGSACVTVGIVGLAIRPLGLSPYEWLATAACLIGIGAGISSPASRNAGLHLAPDRSSSLAALRSMSRQVGQVATVSIATAIIAHSASPGRQEARVFIWSALLLVACLPVIARVPEHRGPW